MLDQAIHDLARRATSLFVLMVTNLGVTGPQILQAIAFGVLVGIICLAVLVAVNIWNAIALRAATRNVEALAMTAPVPQGKAAVRSLQQAFRHSHRLARWALARVSIENADSEKSVEGATELIILPLAGAERVGLAESAAHPYFLLATARYFSIAVIIGGLGQIIAIAIILVGSSLAAGGFVAPTNLSVPFGVTMMAAMAAAGFGISGLVSPLLLWPSSRAVRRYERKLCRALNTFQAQGIDAPPSLSSAADPEIVKEVSLLRRTLEDETRARAADAQRLEQAVAVMRDAVQRWPRGNDGEGNGLVHSVRELTLNIARLCERAEAAETRQAALEKALQERGAADPFRRGLDRVALMSSDLRKALRRMAEATDKLIEVAGAAREASASTASSRGSTDAELLRPVIAEISELLNESAAASEAIPAIAFQEHGDSKEP